jgi:hypothetical protein
MRPPTGVRSTINRAVSRRAAAIGLLGIVLVGAVAGASSGSSSGSSSLRAGAASDVLSVAVTLGFLLAAVTCAIVIWGFATRDRGSSVATGRQRTPFWRRMFIAMFLGLLVATAVALVKKRTHAVHPLSPGGEPHAQGLGPGKSSVHFVAAASISTLAVVAGLVIAVLGWNLLAARRRRRRFNLSGIFLGPDGDALAPGAELPESLWSSLAAVRVPDPEEETDPRKAVVAAYLAMTYAAAEAGAQRRGDETPTEFLQRLLGSLGASHEAARRLTYLFETARYSTRPFQETLRSDAITALRQIRAELILGTVGTAP